MRHIRMGTTLGLAALRAVTCLVAGCVVSLATAQVSVLTYHYDTARTGANAAETALTPANVNMLTFGKVFTQPVDGQIYAQPLIVPNVDIPGNGVHNVVYVCTMHDSVYAFDADNADGANAQPLWKRSFLGAGITPVPVTDVGNGYGDIQKEVGILGTPVIDPATGTLYVLAKTKEGTSTNPSYVHRLHALDLATGAEKFNGPATVAFSVAGVGYSGAYNVSDAVGTRISFNGRTANQRAGLLLLNGRVYVTWASHEDKDPYHGWIAGYSASDLSQAPTVLCLEPNGGRGGIWQGGVAPAADSAGNIYLETGNGSVNPAQGNYGDAVVKIGTSGGLAVSGYFIPSNQAFLDSLDLDLGTTGPLLLPDQTGAHSGLLAASGKEGVLYLLDRDALGGYSTTSDNVVQKLPISSSNNGPRGGGAYWNGNLYYITVNGSLQAYSLSNGSLSTSPTSQSADSYRYPGATPTISADGTANAIAWALEVGAYGSSGPATLRAYDASDLSRELYTSDQAGSRDTCGQAIKFSAPVAANGKVYVGTGTGLYVYGAIPDTTPLLLSGVSAPGATSVVVTFNRPVDLATGQDTAKYAIDKGVTVLAASVGSDGRTVTLTTSPLTSGTAYTLTATGILDRATPPHEIAPSSLGFQYILLSGDGLAGVYHAWSGVPDFSGTVVLTRVDPTVDFDWGSGSPDPAVPANNFAVRWTGFVEPATTETYTFTATSDDGVRLWVGNVDGPPLIDHWQDGSATDYSGSIALVAGRRYPIQMDYYEASGAAVAKLSWSTPTIGRQVIPQNHLYSRAAWTIADVASAMAVAAGLQAPSNGSLYDVVSTGDSAGRVDITDVVALARKATGLDANP